VNDTSSAGVAAKRFPGRIDVIDLRLEDPRWRDLVAVHRNALPYHHPAWSQVLRETFGYRLVPLGCTDTAGRLVGVLPLVEKKSLLAGRHLSSLPNTPTAGPLAIDQDAVAALLASAAALVDHSAAKWLQLKIAGPAVNGLRPGFSRSRWGASYVLDLPSRPDQLRFGGSRHNAAIQRNIRKAARHGVAVREASSVNDIQRWYRLYLQTVRTHGIPPRPLRLFEVIWDVLVPLGLARLLLAERSTGGQSRLLAGTLLLASNGTDIVGFNGRDRSQLEFRPNDAIHWQAIRDACTAGRRRYDFGEASGENEGLLRFKEKWGALPVDLCRYSYPGQREVEQGALAAGPVRRTAEAVWRQLPLPATAALGGWIYGRL
jgi:hypothetical protein